MATSDIVAVVLLGLCVLLGMRGCFRWLSGAVLGLIVGFTILAALGVVSARPWSGQVGGFFSEGSITPSIGRQVENMAEKAGIEVNHDHNTETEDTAQQEQSRRADHSGC